MSKTSTLSQEAFDGLLEWLAPNAEFSGTRYQEVHRRLGKHFSLKGCNCPEELADEVMDRVAQYLKDGMARPQSSEDQLRLFYGFAKNVYFEYLKDLDRKKVIAAVPISEDIDVEKRHRCLDKCNQRLAATDQNLLLHYYQYEPGEKIQTRKLIAEQMQLAPNALRIRVCRLRSIIKECVVSCVQPGTAMQR